MVWNPCRHGNKIGKFIVWKTTGRVFLEEEEEEEKLSFIKSITLCSPWTELRVLLQLRIRYKLVEISLSSYLINTWLSFDVITLLIWIF